MSSGASRARSLVPVSVAVLLQIVVLYAPSGGGGSPFPNFDKLVHAAVFALPVFFALLARLPWLPVVFVAAAHAPVSEFIQGTLLPNRAGDRWDVAADLAGVALGVLTARFVGTRSAARVVKDTPER
ncbi:hypothetical protein N802_01880 [Knoellia sinensis KCTC 19936]|uniref:VanZ-like domain-containing protein n=1 Tax=Knoellia sinensis KCTC 19936 TaxID=1385520 RepID=A0A0A0JFH4_9MICO|nr:hypothetical protein [Knoellia sinensis]KGN34822.1 hypothetical protein N802_01880 [Knoellia sinensis KCTC 19936]